MNSSPRDFRVLHHPRDGVVAEDKGVVSALRDGWRMMAKKEWVPAPEMGREEISTREGENGNQGDSSCWLCRSGSPWGGVVSDSTEIGAAASLGESDSPWLQVRGSGWPGSGALAGGGGGGRIGLSRGAITSRGPGQSRSWSPGRTGAGDPSKAEVGAGGEKLGGEGDGRICSGSESSDGPGGPSSSSTSREGKTPTWPPNSPLQKPSSTPSWVRGSRRISAPSGKLSSSALCPV